LEVGVVGLKWVLKGYVAALLVVGGCAVSDTSSAQEKGVGSAVPSNYRRLVASRILETTERQKIRRAQISRPVEKWVGLINGGNRPAVCAVIYRETPLFAEGRDCWLITFVGGSIASAGYSYEGCNCAGFSPFVEVLGKK
jgi:hypothetical protein